MPPITTGTRVFPPVPASGSSDFTPADGDMSLNLQQVSATMLAAGVDTAWVQIDGVQVVLTGTITCTLSQTEAADDKGVVTGETMAAGWWYVFLGADSDGSSPALYLSQDPEKSSVRDLWQRIPAPMLVWDADSPNESWAMRRCWVDGVGRKRSIRYWPDESGTYGTGWTATTVTNVANTADTTVDLAPYRPETAVAISLSVSVQGLFYAPLIGSTDKSGYYATMNKWVGTTGTDNETDLDQFPITAGADLLLRASGSTGNTYALRFRGFSDAV